MKLGRLEQTDTMEPGPSFTEWYPVLRGVSPKSVWIELDEHALRYLKEDRVFVPPLSGADEQSDGSWCEAAPEADADMEPGEEAEADGEEAGRLWRESQAMTSLMGVVDSAIQGLGGAAFPKMNWSSPRDASWVLGGSLRCQSASDVLSVLKSSRHVAFDFEHCPVPRGGWAIVLRKWSHLHPSREFRCFVLRGRLVCACQRDRFTHYADIAGEREAHINSLTSLWEEHVRPALAQAGLPAEDVVLDVYVDTRRKGFVIDIGPAHEGTDPLLFTWEEVRKCCLADDASTELRTVAPGAGGVQPSPHVYDGVPSDLHPAAERTAGREQASLQELMEAVRVQGT